MSLFFLDAVTHTPSYGYLSASVHFVYYRNVVRLHNLAPLTHQAFPYAINISFPATRTIRVTYIFNVIIQVLPVLAACVHLGEDFRHQLALGVHPSSMLSVVSVGGLQKLRKRGLPITILVNAY